ncbi:MAG: ribosome silencing factor [Proteobacteria bacterium]|nr:ribosome silencing factor [Pseudomonadota bacterium]
MIKIIAEAIVEKKGSALKILKLEGIVDFCDCFIICSGGASRQVRAVADNVTFSLKEQNVLPNGVEGVGTDQWILIDYGDVIVHVFSHDARAYYALDQLWVDAEEVDLTELGITDEAALASPDAARFI